MSLFRLAACALILVAGIVPTLAQEDAVGVPGPIRYDGTPFALAWTSHPTDIYYKQEYLPKGEALESYTQMFMVDVLVEGATPESAARDMVAGLEDRKRIDPVVNYQLISNEDTGEVLLDFLLSTDDGNTVIVEWNAYRYVPYEDGLALFAISRRGYDDGATAFVTDLANWRIDAINTLAEMKLPEITLD